MYQNDPPDYLDSPPEGTKDDWYHPSRDGTLERSLPNSSEAERAILGAILLNNDLINQSIEFLVAADFYVPSHSKIYDAMITLIKVGMEINPILIGEELSRDGQLQSVGGISFITNLTYGLPLSTNITNYVKIVKGKSVLRNLLKTTNKITQEVLAQEDEPNVILDNAQKAVFDIAIENTTKTFSRIGPLTHAHLQKTWELQSAGNMVVGLPTGFADLDAITLGLRKQDLIILAARPSMGKTGFAAMLALNATVRGGANVAFFSLEMSEEALAMRALCAEARIDTLRYQGGYISTEEWHRLGDAQQAMADARLWIEDTPGITALQLKTKARKLISQHGKLDLIIVDYLQKMKGDRKKSKYEEVTEISGDLKDVAKELDVPLVALSQLNRAPENRTDHRPQLADLRESGALEQDADIVAFLFRGDQYKGPNDPKDNIAELIIAKHRNGKCTTLNFRFDAPSIRFDNLAPTQAH